LRARYSELRSEEGYWLAGWLNDITVAGAPAKNNPLRLFAVFSATA